MKKQKTNHLKNTLLPYVLFSALVGTLTGLTIFLFKLASTRVIQLSQKIYGFVRENPLYLPLLVFGTAALGFIASLILKKFKDCRGGGIPTAIASIRGLLPLKWMQGIFSLFIASMLTFISGVPLGNEGPSVQIGTSIGKGTVSTFGKSKAAWGRYAMTGGACAGFAIVTGSPIAGIMFAFEEAHRHFSPSILSVASISVFSGVITNNLLCEAFGISSDFIDIAILEQLPLKYMLLPLIIGAICGLASVLLMKAYNLFRKIQEKYTNKINSSIKISVIFGITAILGFARPEFIGTGHSLIEGMLHETYAWYILLSALLVRALLMIVANCEGVSGGLFVPTLAFGGIIASLLANIMISLGIIDMEYLPLLITIGMAAFLSASSRIPIIALVFAVESLSATNNIVAIGIAVTVSYLIVEFSDTKDFSDTVIESKVENDRRGKVPVIVDTYMRVNENSFADGKEIRDILWPPTCTVLSVDRGDSAGKRASADLMAGDVLHLHYQTYERDVTAQILNDIFGEQGEDDRTGVHYGSDSHIVPER